MNRDDEYTLDVLLDDAGITRAKFHQIATAEGYVKLDVDVDQVREDFELGDWLGMPDAHDVIRQVLAALDGKDT